MFMDKRDCLENAVADSSNELVFNNKTELALEQLLMSALI